MLCRQFTAIFILILTGSFDASISQDLDITKSIEQAYLDKAIEMLGAPVNPNPYLSLMPPGVPVDYQAWNKWGSAHAVKMGKSLNYMSGRRGLLTVMEEESFTGANDNPFTGQEIDRLGSSRRDLNRAIIHGTSGTRGGIVDFTTGIPLEDDGSILLANNANVESLFTGVVYEAEVENGPNGTVSDFDFYKVDAAAGSRLVIDVETRNDLTGFDPVVSLLDEQGNVLAMNDDEMPGSTDSRLVFDVRTDGHYFIVVGGFDAFLPSNPFDSRSGSTTGNIGSEGEYTLTISLVEISVDADYYRVFLEKGDVFSAGIRAMNDSTRLQVRDPDGLFKISSTSNTSFYPESSPVRIPGVTTVYHLAEVSGWHSVGIENNYGEYELELFVSRPGTELVNGTQVIYLDFDGAQFDLNKFFGREGEEIKTLSPFRDFLNAWGLSNDDKTISRITSRITAQVREKISHEIYQSGINPDFSVLILNNSGRTSFFGKNMDGVRSADDLPEVDRKNMDAATRQQYAHVRGYGFFKNFLPVSEVIIGGTSAESGINTVGIAESNDVGNFDPRETALVLLDKLSAPADGSMESFSLNQVPLDPSVTKEDLIVTAIGNIVAHEIGHLIGNWHTDGFNNKVSLMDEGQGGLHNYIGTTPGGVFGDAATVEVSLNTDAYSDLEIYSGSQNTLNQSAFGLSSRFVRMVRRLFGLDKKSGIAHRQSYPNPARVNNEVAIRFEVDESMPVQVRIYSMDGKEVARLYDDQARINTPYEVAFSPAEYGLEKGLYIYRLSSPKGVVVRKILLED